jgi:Arsenate reductase and related proteins, glutaredoxin family
MNIQVFGKNKCFNTKKAERYFKERRIKYQYIELPRYGMSRRELESVKTAVGIAAMTVAPEVEYLAYDTDKLEKLFEYPEYIKTPVVRNGKQATVGYCPDVWKTWE